jgi:GNAT superfamily N-acetyltransferase
MTYRIEQADRPDDAYMPIWAPLLAFNQETVGDAEASPYALTLGAADTDQIAGGLWAMYLWGSFYIALLVVPKDARGQGLGSQLMSMAEAEARDRGCRQVWLDTYAFQARPFYERHGFSVFGQIDGPQPMFPRVFMQKLLT